MRLLRKLRAKLFGYFWLPCPICGRMFGGFECSDESLVDTTEYDKETGCGFSTGTAVCKRCGEKAIEMNRKAFEEGKINYYLERSGK